MKSAKNSSPRKRATPSPAKRKKSAGAPLPPVALALCQALDDKKAEDVKVLNVAVQSSITDFLILATANSETHLRALRIEVERVLKESRTHVVGEDSVQESGWVVVDAFDVMVHLFLPAQREHFALEHLWKDATEIKLKR